ncbi:bifunctional glutamate N-acetyltransferase/amino-acid acetyltransferase ArgJ [Desulfosporosinus sp.]|uniref:bifunctional glutamate N-acetyltransferase/amino-acid acetyltransferase ArgJ n=1 Tax=Desulfosporosinus sp. TaxID=157907 RepID=UPI00232431C7|nr:bifunctional glutamate N-acetyltransferase/amino-acid acetyltransferase ArgJ [Desulfosporosinus sp.]MCO5388140.1 bifunctional glutamate N-acetyltransferase/amino-acid acetyltransferase ArgJ [Desulfosporosinus sp.]MDA8220671.1 bifunctional glutamate N-acetyltransferase/amino-acid acetyltransferase ArgJ [Desulfitobacterium hafniense]
MDNSKKAWKLINGGIAVPKGFYATGVQAGIKYKDKYDVALIFSEVQAQAAAVYTRNLVKAHPLYLTQRHLENGLARAIVINSGNANACVGEFGDQAAFAMAEVAGTFLAVPPEDVLVASTGVIGVEMPLDKVLNGIRVASSLLLNDVVKGIRGQKEEADEGAHRAALAIMTTDTLVKEYAYELSCSQGGVIHLGAIAKGSGMIHPNMGTMLGFLTTDAFLPSEDLQRILREAVEESFNMVTVDGDTSTNDMVVLMANGASGITLSGEDRSNFEEMVKSMCIELAKDIARDGEGATKLMEVSVSGAKTKEDARKIARSICGSSLVKAALFGEDANWGRILTAAGYSGAEFNPNKVDVFLGKLIVAQAGKGVTFSEEEAKEILGLKEVHISLNLHSGEEQATAWGCDLTHEYVTINGSYRT